MNPNLKKMLVVLGLMLSSDVFSGSIHLVTGSHGALITVVGVVGLVASLVGFGYCFEQLELKS